MTVPRPDPPGPEGFPDGAYWNGGIALTTSFVAPGKSIFPSCILIWFMGMATLCDSSVILPKEPRLLLTLPIGTSTLQGV